MTRIDRALDPTKRPAQMRRPLTLARIAVLALATPAVHAQNAWKASGSGTATTLTLETRAGSRSTPRKLILKCHNREAMVGFSIGTLNEEVATVRFDSEPAMEVGLFPRLKWGKFFLSTKDIDPDTKFFAKPAEIISALLGHKRMLVRATPSFGSSVEVTFDLPRLEPHLSAFEQACDLKKPIERPNPPVGAAPSRPPPASAAKAAEPRLQKFGEWRQTVTTSKVDDSPIVVLSLPQAKESSASQDVSLVLRCRESRADAFLSFDTYVFVPYGAHLVVKATVDGAGKSAEWWLSPSTDWKAAFFGSPPELLKRLLGSNELRLVHLPKASKDLPRGESVFVLAGLDQAAKKFLEACPTDLAKVKVRDGLPKIDK